MAEKEVHAHGHRRGAHTGRGRPGYNRLYHHLGVRDLRELLDRKRSERGHVTEVNVPPPDPSYNYLKDPLRENYDNNPPEHSMRQSNTRKHYNQNASHNRKRDKDHHGGNQSSHPKNQDIENPLNIKIEFSTSTGEHVYKMDESTVLPTIKHVPDRIPVQNRSFSRGRGRGRGRGQQRIYHNRTIRNNASNQKGGSEVNQQLQSEEPPHIPLDAGENWDDDLHQTKEENVDEEYKEVCENEEELETKDGEDKVEGVSLEEDLQNLKLEEDKNSAESEQKLEEQVIEKKD